MIRGGEIETTVDDTKLLKAEGLVKTYSGKHVVDGVDLHIEPGEVVGLLGPNGAGKTTSFYMLIGLVKPDGGTVTFDGLKDDLRRILDMALLKDPAATLELGERRPGPI